LTRTKKMSTTKERLFNGLKDKLGDRVMVNGKFSDTLPNTLSVAFEKTEAYTLTSLISEELFISTGSACHADSIEISSVLKAMNIERMTAAGTVRISTGKFTTIAEIDRAVNIITHAIGKL